jgi:hypothetical protein
VVSELTTNAIRATTGPDGQPRYEDELSGLPVIHVRLSSDRVCVLVEVWDRSAGAPTAKHPEPDEEGGRGLVLVDALCEQWSWDVVPGWAGKVVLYTLQPGRRLGWEIGQLADELTDLFGRRVDLVSSRALHPLLRPSVLAEARPLYAA